MFLGKDDILKADDLPAREVDVPEWGGTVRVRGLTATERDSFEFRLQAARNDPSKVQVRAEIVGRCLVDSDGNRLFSDAEVTKLGQKSGAAVDRLFEVVRDLSGMGSGAVEDAAEDFGVTPDGSSPSA